MLQNVVSPTRGDETVIHEYVTAGFSPHTHPQRDGHVNWTEGFIIARGRGIADRSGRQGQLLAKRAATLDAAANALAIAAGINVDANGRAGDMRNGRVVLKGVIKGHQEVSVEWRPDLDPPEMHVSLKVPLWGIKSVSTAFYRTHRQRLARSGARLIPLVADRVDVADCVLVIDARGTDLQASLFPVVTTEGGDLLYDVSRLSLKTIRRQPSVRFVETDMTFEQLQACIEGDTGWHGQGPPSTTSRLARRPFEAALDHVEHRQAYVTESVSTCDAGLAWGGPSLCAFGQVTPRPGAIEDRPSATQPSSQPVRKPRRRPRRRVVVKGATTAGEHKTRIVVTEEDAEKLCKSAEGASLMREGNVVIVVDSVAAGTQGRRRLESQKTTAVASSLTP